MRISDWSSDVCSSDLPAGPDPRIAATQAFCDSLRAKQPPLYAAIEPDALQPDEDPYMFDMTVMQLMFHAIPTVPIYVDGIYRQDWTAPYRYYKQLRQIVLWPNGNAAVPTLLMRP